MHGAHSLPVESLIEIFDWATYSPVREVQSIIDYPTPFECIEAENENRRIAAALRTKLALSLVCHHWRAICAQFLFEYILIKQRLSDFGLASALEAPERFGVHVKRVLIRQYAPHPTEISVQEANETLRRIFTVCPNIRIISLGQILSTSAMNNSDPSTLARVGTRGIRAQRLDLLTGYSIDSTQQPNISHTYSLMSANVLSTTLDLALRKCDVPSANHEDVCLPNLHTLRISGPRSNRGGFRTALAKIKLPSLRRIVVRDITDYRPETPVRIGNIIKSNASRILCFEVSGKPTTRNRVLALCLMHALSCCINLEEVYFPLFLVSNPLDLRKTAKGCRSLRHVGIHITPNDELKRQDGRIGRGAVFGTLASPTAPRNYEEWAWLRLTNTFNYFTTEQTIFPRLEKISLHGTQWLNYIPDSRFTVLLADAERKGITIQAVEKDVEEALRVCMSHPFEGTDVLGIS